MALRGVMFEFGLWLGIEFFGIYGWMVLNCGVIIYQAERLAFWVAVHG